MKCLLKQYRCFALLAVAVRAWPLGFAAQGSESPTTNALTLPEAIHLALANNPGLRAADARVAAAGWRAYQAGKWSNPELGLSAEDWPVSDGGGFSQAKQTVGIAQTLPYPGKKSLDKEIGGTGVKLSEAELSLRRTVVARDVKAAFFRVLATERLAEVSRQLVVVAESSAATARQRVEAGAAAYQEQLRAELQAEQARTGLSDYHRDSATARQTLAMLLGRPNLNGTCLAGALTETPDDNLPESISGSALARHASTVAARTGLDRAQMEARRARLEPYPDVKVGVSGGRLGETGQPIIQVGFSLPLPIVDTGKGRRLEAEADIQTAEAELQGMQLQLQREWANARERYRSAAAQVVGYQARILPKADEALRLVRTGFEEGKFSLMDLLDVQRTTAEARLAYQQKLLEMNVALAELEALLEPETKDFPAAK